MKKMHSHSTRELEQECRFPGNRPFCRRLSFSADSPGIVRSQESTYFPSFLRSDKGKTNSTGSSNLKRNRSRAGTTTTSERVYYRERAEGGKTIKRPKKTPTSRDDIATNFRRPTPILVHFHRGDCFDSSKGSIKIFLCWCCSHQSRGPEHLKERGSVFGNMPRNRNKRPPCPPPPCPLAKLPIGQTTSSARASPARGSSAGTAATPHSDHDSNDASLEWNSPVSSPVAAKVSTPPPRQREFRTTFDLAEIPSSLTLFCSPSGDQKTVQISTIYTSPRVTIIFIRSSSLHLKNTPHIANVVDVPRKLLPGVVRRALPRPPPLPPPRAARWRQQGPTSTSRATPPGARPSLLTLIEEEDLLLQSIEMETL